MQTYEIRLLKADDSLVMIHVSTCETDDEARESVTCPIPLMRAIKYGRACGSLPKAANPIDQMRCASATQSQGGLARNLGVGRSPSFDHG